MLPSAYLSNFALQAVAAQHHKAFMQLQRKQKLLDEQHDSMSTIALMSEIVRLLPTSGLMSTPS